MHQTHSISDQTARSLPDKKTSPLLQEEASDEMDVDNHSLKCIHPPKILRNPQPIDLFPSQDDHDCGLLRDVFRLDSTIIDDGRYTDNDVNDRVDDDTLTSTVDSTVDDASATSKELTETSSIHTEEHTGNSRSHPILG